MSALKLVSDKYAYLEDNDLISSIIKVIEEADKDMTIEEVFIKLYMVRIYTTFLELSNTLRLGVEGGQFKRITSGSITVFSLNKLKKDNKEVTRKYANRPNRGLTQAVIEIINKINGPFYAVDVLAKLDEEFDFPKADVNAVNAVLTKLHRDKTAGFIKSEPYLYLRTQPIK